MQKKILNYFLFNLNTDESSRHSLIGAATQAYVPTRDDSDDEVETDKKLMHEPTQAFAKVKIT